MFRFCLIILSLVSYTSFAQSPNVVWQKTFGGTSGDLLYDLIACSDGNYLLTGRSHSTASGNCTETTNGLTDYWVVKVDEEGTIIWQNKYGGNEIDNLYTAIETSDGGFLLIGISDSPPSGDKTAPHYGSDDIWAVKIDSAGAVIWDKTFGGDSLEFIHNGIVTDYGYILASQSYSGVSGNKTTPNIGASDIWLVGIDFSGNILWQKSYGGNGGERPTGIIKTSDNHVLISGISNSSNSGDFSNDSYGYADCWVLKLDINGNLLWEQNYGGSNSDKANKVTETPDDNYILVGTSNSPISGVKNSVHYGNDDVWVLKIDSNGTLLWEESYGGAQEDSAFNIITTNNGYFIVGSSSSGISGNKTTPAYGTCEYCYDFWGFKIDGNGAILWQKSIGGTASDGCNSIVQNTDGSYLLAGSSSSPISGTKTVASYGDSDYWLVKLEADDLAINDFENHTFTMYPNPVKDYLNIELVAQTNEVVIELFSLLGQRIFKKTYYNQKNIKIDCNNISEGFFNMAITINNQKYNRKLIKKN